MALTLTIGGTNYKPQYKTGSAKITSQLNNQGDSCTMTIIQRSGQSAPTVGQEIIFKDGSRFLFGGFVSKLTPVETGVGQLIEYTLEATDYTYLLVNKYAQEVYEARTLNYIVTDLFSQFMDSGYGLTLGSVATGPTVTTIAFNHISLRQCFENLSKITGYIWWVGYDKVVHFIDPSGGASAPEAIRDSTRNFESVVITVDASQVRNDIVIMGGVEESNNYPQVILGDANAREWVLVYPVTTMVSIELSTGGGAYVTKTFGIDPKDDETLYYAMYNPTRGSVRLSSGSATPGATDKIKVTFTYPKTVLTEVQNASSIIAMKAIEGGDGKHSYTINDTTLLSLDQALQRGLKELDQYSNPTLSGRFITRTGLLSAGSYFTPGQLLTVNLPTRGISVDTSYVILKVVTTMTEDGTNIEYRYEITFGGRLLGVVDLLQYLATPQEPLDESGEVQKIKAIAEVMTLAETITRNNNSRNITESMTVAESISKTNFTPPFKWQPAGSAAKWGKAEWA